MDTYYTDENGQFTTGYYVCGDDWTIREISPSEDYLLDGTVYLKPRLVQIANAVIKSDKYPECKERCRGIKARRGHKKAIIAICRMLLTAIWNVLSKLEPYDLGEHKSDDDLRASMADALDDFFGNRQDCEIF